MDVAKPMQRIGERGHQPRLVADNEADATDARGRARADERRQRQRSAHHAKAPETADERSPTTATRHGVLHRGVG